MTLTIEIPEAVADQLRAEAEARSEHLNDYIMAKLAQPLFFDDEEWDDVNEAGEPNVDLITALREGMDQANRGELLTMEEVSAGVYAALAARREKTAS